VPAAQHVLLATVCHGCGSHLVLGVYSKGSRSDYKKSSYMTEYMMTKGDAGVLSAPSY
jgi:hypothetical protein